MNVPSRDLVDGIRNLSFAMLLFILADIVVLVVIPLLYGQVYELSLSYSSTNTPTLPLHVYPSVQAFVRVMAILLITTLVSIAISVLATLYLRRGFTVLRTTNSIRYGVGHKGALTYLISLIIAALGILTILAGVIVIGQTLPPDTVVPSSLMNYMTAGSMVALVGVIIALAGEIMIAIALFRLGTDHGSALIEVGAVMFVLISIIGEILLYIGLRGILSRLRYS